MSGLLKLKVRKPTARSVLSAATATANLTCQIANMTQFPPVSAVAGVLLLIFQTAANMQKSKQACMLLAQRAAQIVLDVRDQMEGRWTRAPVSLVRNLTKLETTLKCIHEYMMSEAEASWGRRLTRQTSIEANVSDYHTLLDDAARSFQMCTLIDIHYTLGKRSSSPPKPSIPVRSSSPDPIEDNVVASPVEDYTMIDSGGQEYELINSPKAVADIIQLYADGAEDDDDEPDSRQSTTSTLVEPDTYPEAKPLPFLEDDMGFPRYHQSQIRPRGRSSRTLDGWWANATEVRVNGQPTLMKKYEGPREQALEHWLSDVKTLQHVYHPNMPQLVGISDDKTPVPFILLTNMKIRSPEALVLETLRRGSLAFCAELVLRLYRDVSEAALYAQEQMAMSDSDTQNFVEDATYSIDDEQHVVLGLPPPKEGVWFRARSYGLTSSLLGIALKMLPNGGYPVFRYNSQDLGSSSAQEPLSVELQRKLNHLATLVRSLLPDEKASPILPAPVEALITDEYDGRPTLSLSAIRTYTLDCGGHNHTWRENQAIPAYRHAVGDLGIVPEGKTMSDFVKLDNVIHDGLADFEVAKEAWGTQWCWENMRVGRDQMQCFPMGGDVVGWAIAVPPAKQIDCQVCHSEYISSPGSAWRFLLENGKALGKKFNVKPDDLILISRAGSDQDFFISDVNKNIHNSFQQARPPPGRPGFPHQPFGGFGQPVIPKIFYLFTAYDAEHQPYWAETPMYLPKGAPRPPIGRGHTYRIGWNTGSINYVQLYAEDFL